MGTKFLSLSLYLTKDVLIIINHTFQDSETKKTKIKLTLICII